VNIIHAHSHAKKQMLLSLEWQENHHSKIAEKIFCGAEKARKSLMNIINWYSFGNLRDIDENA